MSPDSKDTEGAGLQQELQRIEQQKDELQLQVVDRKRANSKSQAALDELARRATLPGIGDSVAFKLALVIFLVGALVGADLTFRKVLRSRPEAPQLRTPAPEQQPMAQIPHLLITSTPPQAEVLVDGAKVGATPLLHAISPKKAQYEVKVEKFGYTGQRKSLTVSGGRGQSWQVNLEAIAPDPAPEDGAR